MRLMGELTAVVVVVLLAAALSGGQPPDDRRWAPTSQESATQGGRIMAISLHPWVIGQPYRIKALEDALQHIIGHEGVWAATGSEILDAWTAQQA